MSLYALPGLYPPIGPFKDPSRSSSCSRSFEKAGASLSFETITAQGQDDNLDDVCLDAFAGEESKDDGANNHSQHAASSIAVAVVKEARIDTARLIHSLTTTSSKTASSSKHRRAGRPELIRPRDALGGRRAPEQAAPAVTPQEECMEFKLTIHYGDGSGKSCSATRRLGCFLELHRALVQHEETLCNNDPPDDNVNESGAGSSISPVLMTTTRRRQCRIPPVPRVQYGGDMGGGGGGSSSAGCGGGAARKGGFLFLQALVTSYVPRLEEWLRVVLRQLRVANPEHCPALSNFLFRGDGEPPCPSAPLLASLSSLSRSAPAGPSVSPSQSPSSSRLLDSIEESDELDC